MICLRCGSPVAEGAPRCGSCSLEVRGGGNGASAVPMASRRYEGGPGLFARGAMVTERYEVRDLIGEGPAGVIYRALDHEVGIEVALKIISAERLPEPAAREHFVAEMKRLLLVVHANVVRCFDVGLEGERCYLATQICDGLTLHKVLEMRQPLGEPFRMAEALPIVQQIAKGLSALHRQGVVAGALRPSNVVVLPTAIKVADAGLWSALPHSNLELLMAVAGAKSYLAPEVQIGATPDAKADSYSLAQIISDLLGRDALPPPLAEVLAEARAPEPRNRPSAEEISAELESISRSGARRERPEARRPTPTVKDAVPPAAASWQNTQQLSDTDLLEAKEVAESSEHRDTVRMKGKDLELMLNSGRDPTREVGKEEMRSLLARSRETTEQVELEDVLVRDEEASAEEEPLRLEQKRVKKRPPPLDVRGGAEVSGFLEEVPPRPPGGNGAHSQPEAVEEPVTPPLPKVVFADGFVESELESTPLPTLPMREVPVLPEPTRTEVVRVPPSIHWTQTRAATITWIVICLFVGVTTAALVYLSQRHKMRRAPAPRPPARPSSTTAPAVAPAVAPLASGAPCPLGTRRATASGHVFCIDAYEYPGGHIEPRRAITWADAERACTARAARLCTRVEWQAACQGPSGSLYPYGPASDPSRCNTSGPLRPAGTMPLCKGASEVFDMVGNVAEWVKERVALGGSAKSGPVSARCDGEAVVDPGVPHDDIGFRCCVDAP